MSYPNKPAITKYPISDLIKNRWSPRVFADKMIEQDKIMSLFEAARWAPSSRNEQPWRFIYATQDDQANFKKISDLLVEGNAWAKQAALLIISFAKKHFSHNGKDNYNAMYDTGAAALSLVLEAVNQGLVAHQMIGFDKERAILDFPAKGWSAPGRGPAEEYQAASMIAVGYPASLDDLEKVSLERKNNELAERTRKELKEIVFRGQLDK